jgi:hypothetical protein
MASECPLSVIPAKAGIQVGLSAGTDAFLDPRFRGDDDEWSSPPLSAPELFA